MQPTYTRPQLTAAVLWTMIIGSGLVVANNYYNQPLLSLIAKDFRLAESSVSKISVLTQLGYALGLLFIVPLGDLLKRKRMILIDFALIIGSLVGICLAPSIYWLFPLSFLLGFSSVIPQIFVPMASDLAQPEKKVQAVGMVMSGLLIGILLSRVFSGIIGSYFGWRQVYGVAAVIMVLLWFAIYRFLPETEPNYKGSYQGLMKSIVQLFRTEKPLQLAAFRGAAGFGSFSAFWTTLVFHLESSPFHAGSEIAGAFGMVGAVGALAAAFFGKASKYMTTHRLIYYSIGLMLIAWLVFFLFGFSYWGLVLGVILIDLGLQSMHVANQTIIFALNTTASNRVNTVYMTSYFIGGSLGTYVGAIAWSHFEWYGVVGVGAVFTCLALLGHFLGSSIKSQP